MEDSANQLIKVLNWTKCLISSQILYIKTSFCFKKPYSSKQGFAESISWPLQFIKKMGSDCLIFLKNRNNNSNMWKKSAVKNNDYVKWQVEVNLNSLCGSSLGSLMSHFWSFIFSVTISLFTQNNDHEYLTKADWCQR